MNGRLFWIPESHVKSGTQLLAVQVPDVVECGVPCQTHSTVVPTGIVVVLVPLTESTNEKPKSNPTYTM